VLFCDCVERCFFFYLHCYQDLRGFKRFVHVHTSIQTGDVSVGPPPVQIWILRVSESYFEMTSTYRSQDIIVRAVADIHAPPLVSGFGSGIGVGP
jgi:hypothetical protein